MLRAIAVVLCGLACFSGQAAADEVLRCVLLQLEEPDEAGLATFAVEDCPVSGGVPDCFSCVPDYVVFDVNSVTWPEFCPDCFSVPSRRLVSSDRPLNRPIGATQALVDYLPRPIAAANGLRSGAMGVRIGQVVSREVQVESPSNGAVVSVRMFDAQVTNSKGRTRTVRFGLESDRPVRPGDRTLRAESLSDDAFQLVITDRGRRYAVKTRTAMRESGLAVSRQH